MLVEAGEDLGRLAQFLTRERVDDTPAAVCYFEKGKHSELSVD